MKLAEIIEVLMPMPIELSLESVSMQWSQHPTRRYSNGEPMVLVELSLPPVDERGRYLIQGGLGSTYDQRDEPNEEIVYDPPKDADEVRETVRRALERILKVRREQVA